MTKEDMRKKLMVLRERYQERLGGHIQTLRQYYDALEQENHNIAEELANLAHTLAGSGGTYGFRDVSSYALEVEKAVLSKDYATAKNELNSLIDACISAAEKDISGLDAKSETAIQPSDVTILIADDSDSVRDILTHKFEAAGYNIIVVNDGQSALDEMGKAQPDLVVLDRMMPGYNGYDVLSQMKQSEPLKHIPVVFLTAKNEGEDILEGIEKGAVDYITKPFDPDDVIERCLKAIENNQTS